VAEDEIRNYKTIHIDVPIEADPDEAEWLIEEIAAHALDLKPKGDWDPFVHWHTEACEHSDHCYGPGSRVEQEIHDSAINDAIRVVTLMARDYQARKLGNMTWAEVIVQLRKQLWKQEERSAAAGEDVEAGVG